MGGAGFAVVNHDDIAEAMKSDSAASTKQQPHKSTKPNPAAKPAKPAPRPATWNAEQMRNATIIVRVGKQEGMSERAWVIALATAMQESTLHNYGHLGSRNDHDSLGLFQQRPSQGWGSPAQVQNPEYAARAFYRKLKRVRGWENMRLTVAAQRVQNSAYPEAYQKWEDDAARLVRFLVTNRVV